MVHEGSISDRVVKRSLKLSKSKHVIQKSLSRVFTLCIASHFYRFSTLLLRPFADLP